MHYRMLLEDGTVVDESSGEQPPRFTVGDGILSQGWRRFWSSLMQEPPTPFW
jgi:FKBP-type peptidyl-prolyl cis-trans isomerase 2